MIASKTLSIIKANITNKAVICFEHRPTVYNTLMQIYQQKALKIITFRNSVSKYILLSLS